MSHQTVKRGKRNGAERHVCKVCLSWFSLNRKKPTLPENLLSQYLDGLPLRKLADQYKSSPMTIFRKCQTLLKALPQNSEITNSYSHYSSGFLICDGKYLSVKGHHFVLFWGVDYSTHDIPHFELFTSENYYSCLKYFTNLYFLGYPLKYLVCDDNEAIKQAARKAYPKVTIQTCLNHYKENIRKNLNLRSSNTYNQFFADVEYLLKTNNFNQELPVIRSQYQADPRCLRWINDLLYKSKELLAHQQFPHAPSTTNLIEAYNSHLEQRLRVTKGFQSYSHAKLWLNGYILRRRLKPFTDCTHQFKNLNGKCSLENTLKEGSQLPILFN